MGESAFGITFATEDTPGGGIYSAVADVINVTPPQYSAETYDDTDHGNADGYRTYIGGLKDGGEVTLELAYNQTNHNGLIDSLGALLNYRITFPRAADNTCTISAIMTGFAASTPLDDKQTANVTFKVSGKPVWSTV